MTVAPHAPGRRRPRRLQEASLLEAPELLLRSIRGLSNSRTLTWLACVPLALFGLGVFNLSAHAAELPELTPAFLINNVWLLIAAILVIFMNAGFAMVEAGLCRQKNATNILAKNLIVFALAASAYWLIGFSLMYGEPVIPGWLFYGKGGPLGLFFDPTVTPQMVTDGALVPSVDFLFQVAFAGTSATIVSGLVAERIKFGEFVVFSLVLVAFVYPIAGSWKWNAAGWLNQLGFIDFAGSTLVHTVGACAGLAGAMILGPRIGKFEDGKTQAIPGHNLAIATLGCLILWIGWYGFNPGSVLAMNETVPYIAVTTTLGAAGGGIAGTIFSQLHSGKPDLTMTINGILAGLVGITAGCDGFSMPAAWVVGFIAGTLVVFSVSFVDSLGIDDPVGAWSVHGTCGIWGTLAVGLFSTDKGLLLGKGFAQLGLQILGSLSYAIFALVTSWIIWSVLAGLSGGIRVTEREEIEGLDISEHGMEAYPDFASTTN
ncbi:ammonium transporter [Synechococcus sp. Cruz-9H2]|uniref:ammonium transporter n=1 Tax=unclassified Synechococcus TaxID=2626047 RepID=UPI0020CF6CBE|nr:MULTISPECIES: ammonium transporter [unclassified Synechococcus]MCP9819325.1 ammonium transporter [Synechococcus sp. Cruz-9H2]MCP9843118.1 ammonium transporter [Synechococcus sp. Edmonson 11F2]MCP9854863.1 ammonium transporter [Synechococcus sp. Cruz-9C9]MCP9862666.1 ammonium transporter [Synechococcus sp. Cruz-7E5]MCP9870235.1 ammonium transporter [Synechococcus sp. Cruz-7B9]